MCWRKRLRENEHTFGVGSVFRINGNNLARGQTTAPRNHFHFPIDIHSFAKMKRMNSEYTRQALKRAIFVHVDWWLCTAKHLFSMKTMNVGCGLKHTRSQRNLSFVIHSTKFSSFFELMLHVYADRRALFHRFFRKLSKRYIHYAGVTQYTFLQHGSWMPKGRERKRDGRNSTRSFATRCLKYFVGFCFAVSHNLSNKINS